MKEIDYDELGRRLTEAWRSQINADNDPVTAAQIRGAEAAGAVAKWLAREHDIGQKMAKETGDSSTTLLPVEALASLTANELFNIAMGSSDPRQLIGLFFRVTSGYLRDMLAATEAGDDQPGKKTGFTVHGGKIEVPKKEVPN